MTGRGRPVTFDEPAQDEYLRLLATGVRVGDAADKIGISRRTPTQLATRDAQFARKLADAKTTGRTARIPHGTPGGYNNHGCRGPRCTAAATAARAKHRAATTEHNDANTTAQVHPLPAPQPTTRVTELLMLAEVS